ncbi:MAG: hypothetical protein GY714_23755 [Desulfobacterales bacterium]|nr:hypothetical protein [Desulfobacterales bacterium]MCP4161804.1 hypothetical protein [Deltaproteobacteria bacterium]
MKRIFLLLSSVFVLFGSINIYAEPSDASYKKEEYIKLGIPSKINNFNDFAKVYRTIDKLNAKYLPKYNSKKSGELFRYLFNKDIINKIIKNNQSLFEKRKILGKYSKMYSDFADLYLLKGGKFYKNEIQRISLLSTYSLVSTFELMDKELTEKNLTLIDEKILFITKMIGREIWGIQHKITKKKTIDLQTRLYLIKELPLLMDKIKNIKFLDYENNIKRIQSLY